MLNPKKSLAICTLLLLTATALPNIGKAANDNEEPVSVAAYVDNGQAPMEVQEDTLSDIQQYILDKEQAEEIFGLSESSDNSRIAGFNAATANNKILIHVHKSASPEYLEVVRVNQGEETPLNIFSDGTNKALISTATPSFQTCGRQKNQACATPSGTFSVDSMEVMHHSNKFNNAPMPFALFFAANGGIAIHGATPSEYKDLGKPASHGCVRVHPKNAEALFDLVKENGGRGSAVVVLN